MGKISAQAGATVAGQRQEQTLPLSLRGKRLVINDGEIAFGAGDGTAPDATITRSAASTLAVTGNAVVSGTLAVTGATTATGALTATGGVLSASNLETTVAGKGLTIKEGSNARMGTLTLNGATEVTVATTAVTATSRIFLTTNTVGGTATGRHWVSARSAGVSFGVTGIASDTSVVAWMIVEPGA